MSDERRVDRPVFPIFIMLAILWVFAAWKQPTERVVEALELEHAQSLAIIRGLVGPIVLTEPQSVGHSSRDPLQVLVVGTHNATRRIEVCIQLLKVRAITCLAVYIVGLPLLVAAWQVGKASQREHFRKGIPPSPPWQMVGWVGASLGLILPTLALAPFSVAGVLSFGWLGAGGAGISAVGAYLLGRHSRSG